jgi:hypothetical protein
MTYFLGVSLEAICSKYLGMGHWEWGIMAHGAWRKIFYSGFHLDATHVIDGRGTAMLCPYNTLCLTQVRTAIINP